MLYADRRLKTPVKLMIKTGKYAVISLLLVVAVEPDLFFKASDDELMAKIAQGNHGAFRILFDRHGSKVLGYCCRFLANKSKGEDVAQEVWMKVVKASGQYQPEGKFTSWILMIARNACLSDLSGSGNRQEIPLEDHIEDPNSDRESLQSKLEEEENIARLKEHIDALPDQQRAALIMWMSNDSSYEDIAAQLRTSVAAVKSLLFRAKQTLEKRIRGEVA